MKKFISILSVLALLMGLFTSCGRSDEERSKILKIYNWGDYIDEDVLTDFPKWYKEQTGEEVRIIYQVFDINEIMLTKIERGHEDFDLICPSEYILERMLRKNLLLPIDRNFGKTPDYEVPLEGSNIWYDGWAIPKYARNVKAASYFMDYLCRPDIVSRNMEVTGYVSTVATPEILAEKIDTTRTEFSDVSYFFGPGAERVQIDPAQYPDRKVVERCAMIRDFGNETEVVLEMWSRVKGDNLNSWIVILIFAVFGLLFVWVVYKRINRYQQKRRHRRRRSWYKKK